jgi:hypothetical protein
MPKSIEIKVYTLAELKSMADAKDASKAQRKAYEKALEWVREGQADGNYWHEEIIADWTYNLKRIGFTAPRIFFSGFGSQGDGACFTCNSIDFEKLAVAIAEAKSNLMPDRSDVTEFLLTIRNYKPFVSRLAKLCDGGFIEMAIERGTSRYCHEKTVELTVDAHESSNTRKTAFKTRLEEFKQDLDWFRVRLCRAIYRDLESSYDYLMSDEACIGMAEANDYTFTEYGMRLG